VDKEIKLYRRSAAVFFLYTIENQIQKFKLAPIEFELRTHMRNMASSFLNWKTCDIQFAMG
jgi:hypothetical protein